MHYSTVNWISVCKTEKCCYHTFYSNVLATATTVFLPSGNC